MSDDQTRPPAGDWLGTRFLRFERHGSLAVVTVDRPHRRNAMTPSMYFGIRYAIDHVNRSAELAGLLITGTGDVFIPGGDIGGDDETPWGELGLLGMDTTPFEAVRNSPKPIVSAVNGICQGGGLLIAMLSDVAVTGPDATFRAPETLRGIADTGYAQYLPAQIGMARARDLLLTGRTIDAPTAVDWGLVTRLATTDDVVSDGLGALTEATWAAPGARRIVKREINRQYGAYDRVSMEAALFDPEYLEGFRAFKERRPPDWIPDDLRPGGRL
ncbi:MAG: enoyl-CoA hydratase/isomerase family protein [Acidimicrobiia bacterium]|nr:enoyl-CoA hydratase/isomerase family protein [Acidimicrobiia bacterium]